MAHPPQTPRPAAIPIVLLVLLPVLYVLSYAPVYRMGKPLGWSKVSQQQACYKPVDWLIDHTPLNEPLYRWADLWGVRGDFVWAAAGRAFNRGQFSTILATEAETPHLYEHAGAADEIAR